VEVGGTLSGTHPPVFKSQKGTLIIHGQEMLHTPNLLRITKCVVFSCTATLKEQVQALGDQMAGALELSRDNGQGFLFLAMIFRAPEEKVWDL
jgi:hypothetical protein